MSHPFVNIIHHSLPSPHRHPHTNTFSSIEKFNFLLFEEHYKSISRWCAKVKVGLTFAEKKEARILAIRSAIPIQRMPSSSLSSLSSCVAGSILYGVLFGGTLEVYVIQTPLRYLITRISHHNKRKIERKMDGKAGKQK